MNKPTRLLDPRFKYTPSSRMSPDYLRQRFAEIREQLREQEKKDAKQKETK